METVPVPSNQKGRKKLVILSAAGLVILILLLVSLKLFSKDPSDQPQQTSENSQSSQSLPCPSMDEIIANMDYRKYSWEEVDCHIKDLKRLEEKDFYKKMLIGGELYGARTGLPKLFLDYSDALAQKYNANFSGILLANTPPHTEQAVYNATGQFLEDKMPHFAVIAAAEKKKGRPVILINFWDPRYEQPVHDTLEEYNKWMEEEFLPQKVIEAKAAERMKLEYYGPFPLEVEQIIKPEQHPKLFEALGKEDYTKQVMQDFVGRTLATVKEHFKGNVHAHSYYNYTNGENPWVQDISYKGYDSVGFGFFPECNLATSKAHITSQFAIIKKIVNRDDINWWVDGFGAGQNLFDPCGTKLQNIEAEVYQFFLTEFDKVTPKASGLSFHVGPEQGNAVEYDGPAVKIVQDYFKKH